ncbi:uncharacterized protein LOC127739054 [Mytilus californianus]|uniref:uncharacterized protein LOC127739054 n=1 Tax=Mytilus californianus TaxID=6549 RepID=UPI002247D79C|nr:uncharacterized protein LOC127739054 [Mytilus californianus]
MASSFTHFCTICNDDQISKIAVTWCTECGVFLCEDCEKPHRRLNLSKNHKTILTEDYDELPTFITKISIQCKDHKKMFELYCSFHACPCCVQCITDKHQKCQDMKPLSDIIKQFKSSASVENLETDLNDVKENLIKSVEYLKTRISTNNIQKTKAVEKIRYMRKSIDKYLNQLELTLLDELEYKYSKLKSNMNTLVQQMELRANQIDQMQSKLTDLIQYATDLQIYICLIEIEKSSSRVANYFEDLEQGDDLSEKNLNMSISSDLQSILQDVKSFGDIAIKISPSTLQVKTIRKDQAQQLVPNIPDVEQIKPFWMYAMTIPVSIFPLLIKACVVLPDDKFIILDNVQLLLFSNNVCFVRKIYTFRDIPLDVCFVKTNTVVVALGSANKIALVDVAKNRIIKIVRLSHNCDGVGVDDNMMIVSSDGKSTLINLNDMYCTILQGVRASHISLFKGHIYGILEINNQSRVSCYKNNGEHIWTFMHLEIDEPMGLTLDKNGFVYIASASNNSIVVLSPDGKRSSSILSEHDGINCPSSIDINKESGLMMVSYDLSSDGDMESFDSAFVYKIPNV